MGGQNLDTAGIGIYDDGCVQHRGMLSRLSGSEMSLFAISQASHVESGEMGLEHLIDHSPRHPYKRSGSAQCGLQERRL
jgi:hypothetical protein